eukprot:c24076_g1_i1 orf=322-1608(-)
MGCILSSPKDKGGTKHSQAQGGEVFVFMPGMRIPKGIDLARALQGFVSSNMLDHLSALRTRITAMAATGEAPAPLVKLNCNTALQQAKMTLADLQEALDDYLPVLLGLTKEGSQLRDAVEFSWTNQEDEEQETVIANSLYELLSVLHLMAIVGLSQINLLLTPQPPVDGYQAKSPEENKRTAIMCFLKVSGILEYAINVVIPRMPEEIKRRLPVDLKEGVLHALSMQALGQAVGIQLGFAIDNVKATLAVKRRLACEQMKCWQQAKESMHSVQVGHGWGEKHLLFIDWKLAEAKAAAYYYHGLILDERNENMHTNAMSCLVAAHNLLKESRKLCTEFCTTAPATRVPPLWGAMKYLTEKIPKDAISKAHSSRAPGSIPDLPDFPLALQAEEYKMPAIHASWEMDSIIQPSKQTQVHNIPSMQDLLTKH